MNSKKNLDALLQQQNEDVGAQVCVLNRNTEVQQSMDGNGNKEIKNSDAVAIPDDFRCPISLELMRDPVTVCTGQVQSKVTLKQFIKLYYFGDFSLSRF